MIWWCRARLLLSVVVPGLVIFALGLLLAGDSFIALPGYFRSGSNLIGFAQLLPLVVTSTLAYALTQRLIEAEALSRRPIELLDTGLAAAVSMLALGLAAMMWIFNGSQETLAAGRNTLFLAGLMLLAARINAQAATLIPPAWTFIVLFVGYKGAHRPWFWAITLHRVDFAPTFALCALVFVTGLVINLWSRPSIEKA
ncbi:hypothetical protein ACWCOW_31115 [Streptomyces sp. NPDC001939]